MAFKIIKRGANNFWHRYNSDAKEVNMSEWQIILELVGQTVSIQMRNGSNIPKEPIPILEVIVIDETDASVEETFADVEALRVRLVALGYTPYLSAVGIQSIVAGSGITIDNTDPANPIISASGGGGGFTYILRADLLALISTTTIDPYATYVITDAIDGSIYVRIAGVGVIGDIGNVWIDTLAQIIGFQDGFAFDLGILGYYNIDTDMFTPTGFSKTVKWDGGTITVPYGFSGSVLNISAFDFCTYTVVLTDLTIDTLASPGDFLILTSD